jgi:hypothetical protein
LDCTDSQMKFEDGMVAMLMNSWLSLVLHFACLVQLMKKQCRQFMLAFRLTTERWSVIRLLMMVNGLPANSCFTWCVFSHTTTLLADNLSCVGLAWHIAWRVLRSKCMSWCLRACRLSANHAPAVYVICQPAVVESMLIAAAMRVIAAQQWRSTVEWFCSSSCCLLSVLEGLHATS